MSSWGYRVWEAQGDHRRSDGVSSSTSLSPNAGKDHPSHSFLSLLLKRELSSNVLWHSWMTRVHNFLYIYIYKELEETSLKFPDTKDDKCLRRQNANYPDMIITHCMYVPSDHSVFHKYVQLLCWFKYIGKTAGIYFHSFEGSKCKSLVLARQCSLESFPPLS